jgi:importin subunit beta-1
LIKNITDPKSLCGIEASLFAIGYICEEVKEDSLFSKSNEILEALTEGMKNKKEEIKLAASESFHNSLEYFEKNFQVKVSFF